MYDRERCTVLRRRGGCCSGKWRRDIAEDHRPLSHGDFARRNSDSCTACLAEETSQVHEVDGRKPGRAVRQSARVVVGVARGSHPVGDRPALHLGEAKPDLPRALLRPLLARVCSCAFRGSTP